MERPTGYSSSLCTAGTVEFDKPTHAAPLSDSNGFWSELGCKDGYSVWASSFRITKVKVTTGVYIECLNQGGYINTILRTYDNEVAVLEYAIKLARSNVACVIGAIIAEIESVPFAFSKSTISLSALESMTLLVGFLYSSRRVHPRKRPAWAAENCMVSDNCCVDRPTNSGDTLGKRRGKRKKKGDNSTSKK